MKVLFGQIKVVFQIKVVLGQIKVLFIKVIFIKVLFSNEGIGAFPNLKSFDGSDGTFARSVAGCPQFKVARNCASCRFPLV